jgi:hypothetical protein
MRSIGDHDSTGPIELIDQSMERMRPPIAPSPARQAYADAAVTSDETIVIGLTDEGMADSMRGVVLI